MSPNRPYAAGENPSDPTLPHHASVEIAHEDLESVDRLMWAETHPTIAEKSATGKHRRVRSTSTDDQANAGLHLEGEEKPSGVYHLQEPDDSLPDQHDQNK